MTLTPHKLRVVSQICHYAGPCMRNALKQYITSAHSPTVFRNRHRSHRDNCGQQEITVGRPLLSEQAMGHRQWPTTHDPLKNWPMTHRFNNCKFCKIFLSQSTQTQNTKQCRCHPKHVETKQVDWLSFS